MSILALILVLTSAFLHAFWNLAAKRAGRGAVFIFLLTSLSNIVYAPLALALIARGEVDFTPMMFVFIIGNSFLHISYFLLLSYGYKLGDLSLVYPLARGTGPMFSTLAAVILFHERPSLLATAGIICIGIGVMIFSGGIKLLRDTENRAALIFALATGLIIATYTIWDKYAVSHLEIHPLVYDWSGSMFRMLFLGIYLQTLGLGWDSVRQEWRAYKREALIVAILSPLAYILVLTALTFSPVSYIAPAREVSILIGAAMGARLLSEGDQTRRLTAASIIVIGLIALALG